MQDLKPPSYSGDVRDPAAVFEMLRDILVRMFPVREKQFLELENRQSFLYQTVFVHWHCSAHVFVWSAEVLMCPFVVESCCHGRQGQHNNICELFLSSSLYFYFSLSFSLSFSLFPALDLCLILILILSLILTLPSDLFLFP